MTSKLPLGMIPKDAKAPFVRRTLPNVPLFAVPFAGTTKLLKDWSKCAKTSPSTPLSDWTN